MKKDTAIILKEYDNDRFLYQEYGEVVLTLSKSLINDLIHPHQITFRVKDRDSLSNKLLRKNNKYSSIKEITDIVGLRIVTYFENDIDRIAEIFKKEFEIDYPNSIDKREVEADKFGYRSLHYVASLSKTRLGLTEYKKFKGLKFEVQIRSILQHSWAEIEHDLGYKGESEIPETAKRTFYRVAALLEQADIEFVKLRTEISVHELKIKEQIVTNISTVKINKSSLIAFIKESTALNNLEQSIESIACKRGQHSESSYIADIALKRLEENKITSFKTLDDLISDNANAIIEYVRKDYHSLPEPKPETFIAGASILWLFNMLDEKRIPAKKVLPKPKRR
jgi:putative GTP pyrophosphokinase